MSKHLWMYEGTTEYFANLFQINQGLIDEQNFYNRILEKLNYSQRYDDTMSFTEMSAGIVGRTLPNQLRQCLSKRSVDQYVP